MDDCKQWRVPEKIEEKETMSFPIECFPIELKRYIEELAEELQVPVEMIGTGVLTVLALCNQGKYSVECKKGWNESLNLYSVNIAKPSEKKSPTLKRLIAPIFEYESEENKKREYLVKSNMLKKENLEFRREKAKKLKDADKEIENITRELLEFKEERFLQLIVDDITPEALVSVLKNNKEKIGLFSAEGGILATLMGRYSNNVPNIDVILKGYSSDSVRVDRKSRESENLKNPTITIMLFVQPTVVESMFGVREFREKGLCSRFLYCYGKSKVGNRKIRTESVSEEVEDYYKKTIKKLLENNNITEERKIIKLTKEAFETFVEFAEVFEKRIKDDLEELEDWAGKFLGNILRIAGNLHIYNNFEMDFLEITNEEIKKAILLGEYYLEQAQMIYEDNGTNLNAIKAKHILKKLIKSEDKKEEIKKHDLFRMSRGKYFKTISDIDKPLEYLIEKGYLREKEQEAENKAGRPKDIILEINPFIYG